VQQPRDSFDSRSAALIDSSSAVAGNAYAITGSETVVDRATLPRTGKQRRLPVAVGSPSFAGCTAYELNDFKTGSSCCSSSSVNVTNELVLSNSLAMTSYPAQSPMRQSSLVGGTSERSPSARSGAQQRSSSTLAVNHSSPVGGISTGRMLPPHPGYHTESSTARSDFYQTRRPDDAPCYRPTSSTTSSTVSVWNDFPCTPTRFPVNELSSRPPTGSGIGHVAAIRLGVDATSFGAGRSFVSSPSVHQATVPLIGCRPPHVVDGCSADEQPRREPPSHETCVVITNPSAGNSSSGTGHYQVPVSAYGLNGSSIPEEPFNGRGSGTGNRSSSHHMTSGSATAGRHRSGSNAGVGIGLYSGSLPRLGPRSPASAANTSGATGNGFSTSASMPVGGAVTGAGSCNAVVGNCGGGSAGGNWWTLKSNVAGCRDSSDGSSSSCVANGNSLTPPRTSGSKDDDSTYCTVITVCCREYGMPYAA